MAHRRNPQPRLCRMSVLQCRWPVLLLALNGFSDGRSRGRLFSWRRLRDFLVGRGYTRRTAATCRGHDDKHDQQRMQRRHFVTATRATFDRPDGESLKPAHHESAHLRRSRWAAPFQRCFVLWVTPLAVDNVANTSPTATFPLRSSCRCRWCGRGPDRRECRPLPGHRSRHWKNGPAPHGVIVGVRPTLPSTESWLIRAAHVRPGLPREMTSRRRVSPRAISPSAKLP